MSSGKYRSNQSSSERLPEQRLPEQKQNKYLKNMHRIQIDTNDDDNIHKFRPSNSQERESYA